MSPDSNSPVKGFRPLGGSKEQNQQEKKEEPQQPSSLKADRKTQPITPTPSSPPPATNPFPSPPPSQLPQSQERPKEIQSPSPKQPEWNRQIPNPPPPPPWQEDSQPQPAQISQQAPGNQQSVNYPQQNQQYTKPGPNPNTAYILELVGGLFGFFGIGYMYVGRTGEGAIRLIGGICCNIFVGIMAAVTAGICAFIALPVYIVIAMISASAIKNWVIKQNP